MKKVHYFKLKVLEWVEKSQFMLLNDGQVISETDLWYLFYRHPFLTSLFRYDEWIVVNKHSGEVYFRFYSYTAQYEKGMM
jgi:hypothetical protein